MVINRSRLVLKADILPNSPSDNKTTQAHGNEVLGTISYARAKTHTQLMAMVRKGITSRPPMPQYPAKSVGVE